ncbi:MAG: toll/interleukin-1 receptor domain-containing protein [Proteobacteria bacterium]|nr:toll/interleukin-1 receptor domain-containing protein [Pseudomonadota bacterium]
MRAFGVKTSLNWENYTEVTYVLATLEKAEEAAIIEMGEDLGFSASALATPPKLWVDDSKFRLFISHVSARKDIATRLRACLEPFHISGFVAHEDILPTVHWEAEIQRALHMMDAFLAIHTDGFSKSVWTQQEIGFAVARGVRIISFKMGEDPTGFISKQQALPRLNRNAEQIAVEVRDILAGDDLTKERYAHTKFVSEFAS